MSKKKQSLSIVTKDEETRWVAISADDKVLVEGKTPKEVFSHIDKTKEGAEAFLMFVPKKGVTYIF